MNKRNNIKNYFELYVTITSPYVLKSHLNQVKMKQVFPKVKEPKIKDKSAEKMKSIHLMKQLRLFNFN